MAEGTQEGKDRRGWFKRLFSFKAVYYMIAIATAQHTAWGAATTMQGVQPTSNLDSVWWWMQGLFFAIAIDITMVMVATKIRNGGSYSHPVGISRLHILVNWYVVTFAILALFSTYFQLMFAWAHSNALQVGTGVASIWIARLQSLIDARVVLAPIALPAIATLYTIGGFGKGGETQSKQRNVATRSQSLQPDAIRIERVEPLQLQASRNLALPAPQVVRNESGNVTAYICPGCKKQLSISGWSRHKRSCVELQHLVKQEGE